MNRTRAIAVASLAAASMTLSGCIALAVVPPLAAAGVLGRQALKARKRTPVELEQAKAALPAGMTPSELTTLPPPSAAPRFDDTASLGSLVTAMTEKLARAQMDKSETPATRSVILMPGATPDRPQFTLCEDLPPALVVDLDTSAGAQVPASDAMADAFDVLREAGIKVIFVSAAEARFAPVLETDLMVTGLGPATRGDTLLLAGDRASSDKETLLWKIASSHCVVAIAGGDYSDFTPSLLSPPDITSAQPVRDLPGKGWFILPQLQAKGAS